MTGGHLQGTTLHITILDWWKDPDSKLLLISNIPYLNQNDRLTLATVRSHDKRHEVGAKSEPTSPNVRVPWVALIFQAPMSPSIHTQSPHV